MKKSLLWIVVLVLSISMVVAFSFAGCKKEVVEEEVVEEEVVEEEAVEEEAVEEEAEEKTYNIGVSLISFFNEYCLVLESGIKSTAEELGNVELTILSAEADPLVQIGQIETFITKGVDAIIMMPCEFDASSEAIRTAKAAGIPIINICTTTKELADSYIGSQDQVASEIAIELIAKKFEGKEAKIGMMTGLIGQSAEIGRTEGAHEAIKKYPNLEIITEQSGAWVRDKGLEIMENWIQGYGEEMNVLYAQCDEMALGALEAIEAAGIRDKFFIIGVDGIKDAREAVKNGRMDATILQNGFVQARGAIFTALKILKGESYEETVYVPFESITADNIDVYYDDPYGQSKVKFD